MLSSLYFRLRWMMKGRRSWKYTKRRHTAKHSAISYIGWPAQWSSLLLSAPTSWLVMKWPRKLHSQPSWSSPSCNILSGNFPPRFLKCCRCSLQLKGLKGFCWPKKSNKEVCSTAKKCRKRLPSRSLRGTFHGVKKDSKTARKNWRTQRSWRTSTFNLKRTSWQW